MPKLVQGLLIALLLPMTSTVALADDDEAIRERLLEWREAFNARDADGACDLFAPDLSYSVPGILHGDYETMCGNFKQLFEKPGLKFTYAEPDIHQIFTSGEIGIVRLTWTLTTEVDGSQETTTEEGLDVFVRQPDGRWSIRQFVAY